MKENDSYFSLASSGLVMGLSRFCLFRSVRFYRSLYIDSCFYTVLWLFCKDPPLKQEKYSHYQQNYICELITIWKLNLVEFSQILKSEYCLSYYRGFWPFSISELLLRRLIYFYCLLFSKCDISIQFKKMALVFHDTSYLFESLVKTKKKSIWKFTYKVCAEMYKTVREGPEKDEQPLFGDPCVIIHLKPLHF